MINEQIAINDFKNSLVKNFFLNKKIINIVNYFTHSSYNLRHCKGVNVNVVVTMQEPKAITTFYSFLKKNKISLMFLYLRLFQQKIFCTNFYKLLETEINKYWS